MIERPILMSAPMVRATLREVDPKSQTRRVVQPRHQIGNGRPRHMGDQERHPVSGNAVFWSPYGIEGDRLWVRETAKLCAVGPGRRDVSVCYRATSEWGSPHSSVNMTTYPDGAKQPMNLVSWTPAIHMPRWASRITLEILAVRAERLQNITEADCRAEGFTQQPEVSRDPKVHRDAALDWYMDLWDSLNSKRGFGWRTNPYVWVITFRRMDA